MDLIQARQDIREEIEFMQRICDSYVTHHSGVAFRIRERLQKKYEELLSLDCTEPKADALTTEGGWDGAGSDDGRAESEGEVAGC